jgi:hypothetical protein
MKNDEVSCGHAGLGGAARSDRHAARHVMENLRWLGRQHWLVNDIALQSSLSAGWRSCSHSWCCDTEQTNNTAAPVPAAYRALCAFVCLCVQGEIVDLYIPRKW